jgi:hypothetical protein
LAGGRAAPLFAAFDGTDLAEGLATVVVAALREVFGAALAEAEAALARVDAAAAVVVAGAGFLVMGSPLLNKVNNIVDQPLS